MKVIESYGENTVEYSTGLTTACTSPARALYFFLKTHQQATKRRQAILFNAVVHAIAQARYRPMLVASHVLSRGEAPGWCVRHIAPRGQCDIGMLSGDPHARSQAVRKH